MRCPERLLWSRELYAAAHKAIFGFALELAACKTLASTKSAVDACQRHRGRARLASGDHCRTPDDQSKLRAR